MPIIMPLIASLLALLILGSAAHAQDPARHGRALLKEFCANCHALGKTGNGHRHSGPPLRTLGRSFDLDQFPRLLERVTVCAELLEQRAAMPGRVLRMCGGTQD